MAHALPYHDGPCKQLHGHSYQLDVTVKGKVINAVNESKDGMVLDFSILKSIVKELVVDRLDHAVMLREDIMPDLPLQSPLFQKIVRVPFSPTCENMLADFAKRISERLPSHIQLHSLKLRETPTSYAEWFAADNA